MKQPRGSAECSFAPSGLACFHLLPTACAVGCSLSPLRGWITDRVRASLIVPASGLRLPAWHPAQLADGVSCRVRRMRVRPAYL